jgi:transposase-like protein
LLLKRFNRLKRAAGRKWHMDETYIRVRGRWMYLYRAIDSVGATVEFWFSKQRDLPAAKRFLRKALVRHGQPVRIVVDGSQPTGKLSFHAMPRTACVISRGDHEADPHPPEPVSQ